ncbi:MAG: 16S rRNA (guanine(527)-N(7))-methyltransferase RsmG [Pyrinomonadaceae bacterium]|nr:16S rRNA (guanine(527)-N(7))-methyltransferase RsmG [Pyrinomonadaceae bacterium]
MRDENSFPHLFYLMSNEFIEAIKKHQSVFGQNLSDEKIALLNDYYELIQEDNELLHLVAPCSAEEFAVRHILESLTMLGSLPLKTRFADIGTGAGLPAIPCLIVRDDLRGMLIESKAKKTDFLQKAVEKCKLEKRVKIINKQFEEARNFDISYVSCRALDKFTDKLPRILKWSEKCGLLFFGGNSLREALQKNRVKFKEKLMPMSEQRFLFISKKQK